MVCPIWFRSQELWRFKKEVHGQVGCRCSVVWTLNPQSCANSTPVFAVSYTLHSAPHSNPGYATASECLLLIPVCNFTWKIWCLRFVNRHRYFNHSVIEWDGQLQPKFTQVLTATQPGVTSCIVTLMYAMQVHCSSGFPVLFPKKIFHDFSWPSRIIFMTAQRIATVHYFLLLHNT